ncbi:MAG TPA: phasin family protein [Alphaproteobacteria bacterium]|nr:phasin family protein [Alphaproteobacteria bacterium]
MTKNSTFGNPFADIDYTKMFAEFKMPGINTDLVAESYRKNVEAISAASQVAIEGMQAVIKRQSEILRESVEEYAQLLRGYTAPTSPEEAAAKQAELAKHAYETTLAHLKELSDLIAKSNADSIELLNKRIGEMLDEVKGLAAKKKAKAN